MKHFWVAIFLSVVLTLSALPTRAQISPGNPATIPVPYLTSASPGEIVSTLNRVIANVNGAIAANAGGGGGGSGTVTNIAAGFGLSTSPGVCGSGNITTTGTMAQCTPSSVKTTNYTVLNGDGGGLIVANSGSAIAFTLGTPSATGNFAVGWCTNFINQGAGTLTVSATGATIYGAVATIAQNGFVSVCSDGTNYAAQGYPATAASGVTWPSTGNLVLSNTTNSPAGLAEIDGDCVVGAGGVWTAGACAAGGSTAASFNATTIGTGYQLNGANGLSYPAADSTAGASIAIGTSALSNMGASAAYHNTAVGYQAISGTGTTASVDNTAIGYQALKALTSGTGDTAVGSKTLLLATSANASTAIGDLALTAMTTTGNAFNTAVGYGSGSGITTGSQNVFVGSNAGLSITTGAGNTLVGHSAIGLTTSSAQATGVGNGIKLGSNDTAVGYQTLAATTTNTLNNSAFGWEALHAVTSGATNVAIGYSAGLLINSGASNTIIGANVGSTTLTTGGTNLLIGTGSGVTTPTSGTSNYMNIANMIVGDTSKGILIHEGPTVVVSACGTSPTLKTGSNDMAGEVTVGATGTSCTITFANAHTAAPVCVVTAQTALTGLAYTISTTAIVVSATGLGGDLVDYMCVGVSNTTNPTP